MAVLIALSGCVSVARPEAHHRARYVRVSSRGTAPECTFSVVKREDGWTIDSATGTLRVSASYDASDALIGASASLGAKTVAVETAGDSATVRRPGLEAQEFDAPRGVIVTSAPDWTDAFLICRRWNRSKAGRQEFHGLWIHPVQAPMRLTFAVERVGSDRIQVGPFGEELDRLSIRLRGNSAYVAWVDPDGRMIKLMALPVKEHSVVLVLEGYQQTAAALNP